MSMKQAAAEELIAEQDIHYHLGTTTQKDLLKIIRRDLPGTDIGSLVDAGNGKTVDGEVVTIGVHRLIIVNGTKIQLRLMNYYHGSEWVILGVEFPQDYEAPEKPPWLGGRVF